MYRQPYSTKGNTHVESQDCQEDRPQDRQEQGQGEEVGISLLDTLTMDITGEVGKRFELAAGKASRRLSRQGKSQSKVRHGERSDPAERLMDKIVRASRPGDLSKKKASDKPPQKKTEKDDKEPTILPVPKVSSNG